MNNDIKEIREYIACPQFGDDHYGKWGALRLDQRQKIKSLLDYITNLQEENKRLKDNWEKMGKFIAREFYLFIPINLSAKYIMILIDKMHEIEKSGEDNG